MAADIKEDHDWQMTYTITGTQQEVQQVIDNLMKTYDPCGFFTHVEYNRPTGEGMYEACVTRSNSCD